MWVDSLYLLKIVLEYPTASSIEKSAQLHCVTTIFLL
ncbi:Uncharacterised protein [Providencia rustigianii]|nr:Uncharacterised protein [Providencia rustigianii]SUC25857.1 Uncharacterised protein [Providencia rustigianii]VEB63994.1 Uncharacterised protein [Providencia rustigianii]